MEKLACRSSSFVAKTIGTVVSIAGAFVVTLYKGREILTLQSSSMLHYHNVHTLQSSWIIGGLFLAADCVVASGYIIVQVPFYKRIRGTGEKKSYKEKLMLKKSFIKDNTHFDVICIINYDS